MDTHDWFDFSGQVAIVNGAGGIGREIAMAFSQHGAHVVVADLDGDRAKAVAAEAENATSEQIDIRSGEAVEDLVGRAWETHGKIDVVVNTAAIYVRIPAVEMTEEEFDLSMDVNVKGTWFFCQAAAKRMVPAGHGRLINYISNAGIRGSKDQLVYNTSKAAVIGLTRTLGVEFAPTGVTVNAVAPGPTDTELMASTLAKPGMREMFAEKMPIGALTPVDVTVGPVLFLASPQAKWITGQLLFADGGMSAA